MQTLHYAFLIAALVCAILAALQLSTQRLNLIALALALFFASLLVTGCSVQSVASNELAQNAVTAVAKHYGGEKAGELAAAGLSASAEVLQGYVDKKPPLEVAANSPGVKGVSQVVADYLKTKGVVTQKTIDDIHLAAQVAGNATVSQPSTVNGGP